MCQTLDGVLFYITCNPSGHSELISIMSTFINKEAETPKSPPKKLPRNTWFIHMEPNESSSFQGPVSSYCSTLTTLFYFLNLCMAPPRYWHIVHAHLDLTMRCSKLVVCPGYKSAISDFSSLFSYPHPVTSVMPSSYPPQDLNTCYFLCLELFPTGVSHGCLFVQASGQIAPWRRLL